MKQKLFLLIAGCIFFSSSLLAQTAGDYRSKMSGNWNAIGTWERYNGIAWVAAVAAPTSADGVITIQNSHTVTINVAASARLLTINTGGVLTYSGSGIVLTIPDDGTNATDFSINGRYELYGTQPVLGILAKVEINSGGEVRANNNTGGQSDNFARSAQVYFHLNSFFSWNTTLAFQTNGVTYFPNATNTDYPTFRVTANNVGNGVGAGGATVFNCKFEINNSNIITFNSAGTKTFTQGFGGTGTVNHSISSGTFQITGTAAVIDGTVTLNINNSGVGTSDFEIASGAIVTTSGTPVINIGTATNIGADLFVTGSLVHTSTSPIVLIYGNVTYSGLLSGNGTFTCSSTQTSISVTKSSSGSVGTLNLTSGSSTVKNFTMSCGVSDARIVMGSDMTVANNISYLKGDLVTGNNLITWNNSSGGIQTLPTLYTDSYVAICDAAGVPLTTFDGTKGFRINNVGGSTDIMFPVGSTYLAPGTGLTPAPERVMINNSGTTDNFTVVISTGGLPNTPLPSVYRTWHITEAVAGGSKVSMKLFFTKVQDVFGTDQNLVEDGFIYNDLHLIQETVANQFVINGNGTDVSSLNWMAGTYNNKEVYAQYTRGVGINIDGTPNVDGITNFSYPDNRFSITNAQTIILPVDFSNFSIAEKNRQVMLSWRVHDEASVSQYEVERSFDGRNFLLSKKILSNGSGVYTCTDSLPVLGINYYRISAISKDGSKKYSKILSLDIKHSVTILVMPNPVSGVLQINGRSPDQIVQVIDINGKEVTRGLFDKVDTSPWPPGIYFIKILGSNSQAKKIVKE